MRHLAYLIAPAFLFIAAWSMKGLTERDVPRAVEVPPGMVYVPGGEFIMGSEVGDAYEKPRRKVYVDPFFIDIYEVTNEQFAEFDPTHRYSADRATCPAEVTWYQADAYARWAGKRLPTEVEWEKACRGTDGRTFPWGEYFDIPMIAWDDGEPVGKALLSRSPYGCYDMAGNVWEWVSDWYKPYPGNTVASPAYGEKYKVIRGGAAFNDVSFVRCAHRYYVEPDSTVSGYHIGFRCVRSAT